MFLQGDREDCGTQIQICRVVKGTEGTICPQLEGLCQEELPSWSCVGPRWQCGCT
ncbi:hypothetical protein FCM35_KLT12965 [Carex littledalei]|uniref:Uncharacterized protein n=1 Tax=Carex littledalei TaxID=544730 RepID=A0A833V266_9POAL|nr:hypothetical protein FCM35_KLT12965 [Carex littledalei]